MRVLILGYGSIGKRHHEVLKTIDPDVSVDIFDPQLGYNQCILGPTTDRYDIGLVCTQTVDHLWSARNIRDYCDLLFIEKPLHSSSREMKRMSRQFTDSKIHVGCNIRYTQAVEKFKGACKNARLIRITAMSDLSKWRHDPGRRSYSFRRAAGGGVLLDFIHEPDYVAHCLGYPNRPIVVAEDRLHSRVTEDSDDSCMMLWQYGNKLVSFCLSYGSEEYVRRIDILNDDTTSEVIHITKDDVESSYRKQWLDVLKNGPSNSYDDCLTLHNKLFGST